MSIPFCQLEFFMYLRRAKKAIFDAHQDKKHSLRKMALKLNMPTDISPLKNDKKEGIILIHGLLDSPASMQSLQSAFSEKGYHIKTLLLDGHGTKPENLMHIHYQHWIYQVLMTLDSFDKDIKKIHLVGLSTGALLAIKAALMFPEKIDKLILFCPAFKLSKIPQLILPFIYPLRNLIPWVVKKEENNIAKYRSVTTNAAFQVRALGKKIRTALKKTPFTHPVYMILSGDDETICAKAAMNIFYKLQSKEKHLRLYTNHHYPEKANTTVIQSCFPDEKILNFSHVCLTNAPDCSHYGKITHQANHYQGALNARNLSSYCHLMRNSYNPDFDNQFASIYEFLKK